MVVGVRIRSVIVVVDDCPCLRLVGYNLTPGVRAGNVIAIPAQPREPEQHEGRYEGKEPSHSQNDDGVGHVQRSVMGDVVINVRFDLHVQIGDHADRYPYNES